MTEYRVGIYTKNNAGCPLEGFGGAGETSFDHRIIDLLVLSVRVLLPFKFSMLEVFGEIAC